MAQAHPKTSTPGNTRDIGMFCPTAPERIWLQSDPESTGTPIYPTDPSPDDVTWCADKINNSDTRYVRADLAVTGKATASAAGHALRAALVERRVAAGLDIAVVDACRRLRDAATSREA